MEINQSEDGFPRGTSGEDGTNYGRNPVESDNEIVRTRRRVGRRSGRGNPGASRSAGEQGEAEADAQGTAKEETVLVVEQAEKKRRGRPRKDTETVTEAEAKAHSLGILMLFELGAISAFGPDAAMKPQERLLIEKPLQNVLKENKVVGQTLSKYFDLVSLGFGLIFWSTRLAKLSAENRQTPNQILRMPARPTQQNPTPIRPQQSMNVPPVQPPNQQTESREQTLQPTQNPQAAAMLNDLLSAIQR